jgi:peptidoglycan/LPS O-acetylase OafA/YrhL
MGFGMQFRIFGFWRLFAAFLVMSYHYAHYAPENAPAIIARFERMMPLLDMFFMISGFLIYQRYHDRIDTPKAYGAYLIKRLARLYPLHLMTTGFFVLVGLAVSFGLVHSMGAAGGMSRYDWSQLPENLFLIQAWGFSQDLTFNYVSWSLSAEWFCYLALPVIIFAARRGGLAGLFVLLGAVVFTLEWLTAHGVMPFESWMKASTWGAYRAFADFIIGAIICVFFMRSTLMLRSSAPAWVVIVGAVVGMHLGVPPYLSLAFIALALFLAAVSERNAPESYARYDFLAPIANVSFGIYLWHPVMEALFLSFLWRRYVEPSGLIGFVPYLLIPMSLTVLISLLSYRLAERPANNAILKAAGFKRQGPSTAIQAAE